MARQAYRASVFHLLGDPAAGVPPLETYFDDGVLVVEDGHVVEAGAWRTIGSQLGADVAVTHHPDALIVPGFVDAHVHYPQIDIIASPAAHLLDWLDNHTFPSEMRFADRAVADETAHFFLDQLLRHGTTTALVFPTVHKGSVEALFEAALARNMRLAAGKVLMDRGAPAALCDTAETGYGESLELIRAWHGKGRLSYAVTPRFAVTSSERQLELAGRLLREHPGVLLHTHLAENHEEIAEVRRLFPDCADYLGVYEKFGLATDRSVFAHSLHLSDGEWHRMGEAHSAIAFCPTSNLFLGSGLFDTAKARHHHVCVGLGTDVGGGTSLSLLQTMNEAFKVGQLRRQMIDPFRLFYLATLGGAKALKMDSHIGNFVPGKEADFVVLDPGATPLLKRRTAFARGPAEQLFALAMLGDDRAVMRTYIMGELAYSRS
ncbi:MAG TPA: guanine deaminase [Rhizomicrobium sp.]|jgi:guanine deaminase|nr:guanine deaminase [Rhizomicrobium sp.]